MEQLRPLRVLIAGQQNTLDRVMATTIRNWGHESIILPSAEALQMNEMSAVEGDVLLYDLDTPLQNTAALLIGKETSGLYQRPLVSGNKNTLTLANHGEHWRKPVFRAPFTIALSSHSVSRTMLERIGAIALLYKPFEMGRLQRYLSVLQRLLWHRAETGMQFPHQQKKARVLVVDDDVHVAHAIEQCLIYVPLQEPSYEVAVAHDGLEALEYCVDWHPHCIVTDLLMPWMNGYQVMRCLSAGVLRTIPT